MKLLTLYVEKRYIEGSMLNDWKEKNIFTRDILYNIYITLEMIVVV
jgi:hypothetical protein